VWDALPEKPRGKLPRHEDHIYALAFRGDGRELVSYTIHDNKALLRRGEHSALWDLPTGRRLRPLLNDLRPEVNRLAVSPDGKALLLGCRDHTARLWDLETDKPIGELLPHGSSVAAVAFAPDGRRFLTGCRDGLVRLWDTAERRPLLREPLRHPREVTAVAFSPDGGMILVADQEGTARFWDVASGQPLGVPLRHADAILSLAFHPDGRRVVTAGQDRHVRQWQVPQPPADGSAERLRLWVEVLTGLELDEAGALHTLSREATAERRRSLEGLGGPP
jgi:WD40 repeat protein